MPKKLSADEIRALNGLDNEQREGLLALLTEVDNHNAEIQRLRKSQPTESQKVVETAEWEAMDKAVKERDSKLTELQKKIDELSLAPELFYGPFDAIFALFK